MWENSGIFRMFSLPVMQSACCVKTLHGHHSQDIARKHILLVLTTFAVFFLIQGFIYCERSPFFRLGKVGFFQ
jgi:hypothetical protein